MIILPVAIALVCAIIVIRFTLWNRGFFHVEPDWESLSADIGAEAADYIVMPSAEVLEAMDDGIVTVVLLGDDTIASERGITGISNLLKNYSGATVYNCAFSSSRASSVYSSFNVEYGNDAFSFYRLATSIRSDDYTLQRAYLETADIRQDYFMDTIDLLDDIDFTTVDILVLNYGVSDYLAGAPVDNEDDHYDLTTYGGSLRVGIDLLQETYPNMTIVIAGPYYVELTDEDGNFLPGDSTRNEAGAFISSYMSTALDICRNRNISFIDNFFGLDDIRLDPDTYLDETHTVLSYEGRQIYARKMAYTLIRRLGFPYTE